MWSLTPREWTRELVAWKRRQEAGRNAETRQAWLTALLTRSGKKLPDLESLMIGDRPKGPQSVGQMKGVLHMLSQIHGGRVGKRGTKQGARRG